MLTSLLFQETDAGAVIVRCSGSGEGAVIPERIGRLPVTGIADHCFAREMSDRYPASSLQVWQNPVEAGTAAGMDPWGGNTPAFSEIQLPLSVRWIGRYAFYGCRRLERLRLPLQLQRLESGALIGCSHLRFLDFETVDLEADTAAPQGSGMIHEMICELDHEAEVSLFRSGQEAPLYSLAFPGYYEESIENTPARIIEIHYEGTGYKYRQCFRRGELDFERYDALFYTASVQETQDTAMRIALLRLAYPYQMKQKAKEEYLEFLRSNSEACAGRILREDDLPLLKKLAAYGYFDAERLEEWTALAAQQHRAQIVGYLMDYKLVHFSVRQKTYDF